MVYTGQYLTYPEDQSIALDLRMSAVVIMSHLDRLCTPYLPPSISHKVCHVYTGQYLTYPEDQSIALDLRMSAVVIMSHLDRLSTPYLPPSISHKVCHGLHWSVSDLP